MLRQLLSSQMHINGQTKEIEKMFENFCKKASLDNSEIRNLVQTLSSKHGRVYVVVDGVDDDESDEISLAKKYLAQLVKNNNFSVFTTSIDYEQIAYIPYCDVCGRTNMRFAFSCEIDQFDVCLKCNQEVKVCPQGHELNEPSYTSIQLHYRVEPEVIRECVRRWLDVPLMHERVEINGILDENSYRNGLASKMHQEKGFKEKIILEVSEKAQSNLRLARFWIKALIEARSDFRRNQILYRCPSDELKEMYSKSLRKVIHHELRNTRTLALNALALLMAATKPITLRQLEEATASAINPTRIDMEVGMDVKSILKELVVFSNGNNESGYVWLRDGVLKIYLSEEFTRDNECGQEAASYFKNPHLIMAKACFALLDPCKESQGNTTNKRPAFLSYVLEPWGDHTQLALTEKCDKSGESDKSNEYYPNYREQSSEQREFGLRVCCFLKNTQSFTAYMHALENSDSVPKLIRQWVHRDVSPLHVCAWFGMSTLIKRLVGDIDVNVLERRASHTPLMYAALKGHRAAVNELLNLGSNINITNEVGDTALVFSIRNFDDSEHEKERRVEVFDCLRKSAKVGVNDIVDPRWERTALMVAAAEDQPHVVTKLLKEETVDINKQDLRGFTALLNAIYENVYPFRIAKALLNHPKSKISLGLTDKLGRNALVLSIDRVPGNKEFQELVSLLLEKGADPTLNDCSGRNAVTWAVSENRMDILELLLRNPRIKQDSFKGAMLWASEHGYHEAIRLLCNFSRREYGAAPDLNDGDETYKFTALHRACLCEKTDRIQETLETLLEFGADPSVKDKQGMIAFDIAKFFSLKIAVKTLEETASEFISITAVPPLILAEMARWDLVTDAIRDRSVDIHDKWNWTGDTLLHLAVKKGKLNIVRQLLSNLQVRIDETDFYCRTPLHLAAEMVYENIELVQLLVESDGSDGSSINAMDWNGSTPLDLARAKGKHRTVDYLLKSGAKSGRDERRHLGNHPEATEVTQAHNLEAGTHDNRLDLPPSPNEALCRLHDRSQVNQSVPIVATLTSRTHASDLLTRASAASQTARSSVQLQNDTPIPSVAGSDQVAGAEDSSSPAITVESDDNTVLERNLLEIHNAHANAPKENQQGDSQRRGLKRAHEPEAPINQAKRQKGYSI
jgi:ankyrin repeat protein